MRGLVRAFVLCLVIASPPWGQVGSSVLTGIVEDATQARIPGVTVVAANTQTGVQTTGSYNTPNLTPGTYTLRAWLPGFRPQVFENIALGGNETRRFTFTLQVAATETTVEVSVDAAIAAQSVRLVPL